MPISAGDCKGGHGCVGIFIPKGTPFVGGPHDKDKIVEERFMSNGASGLLVEREGRIGTYHPWPCDDNSTAQALYYMKRGNL